MSWLAGLWTGLKDAFGMGLSAVQTKMNYDINQQNYNLAKDNYQFMKDSYLNNFEYQKNLQQQIFGREDNAVQRRVADLQKAGLSKTLAAGDGAGAGTAISTSPFSGSAPQRSPVDLISAALQLSNAQAQIRKTNAETENLLKDSKKKDTEVLFTDAQTAYVKAKTAVEEKNYSILDLTSAQIQASTEKTKKDMEYIDSQILSLEQGREIKAWQFENIYPKDLEIKCQQVANLRKEGRYKDAQVIYQDILSDVETQNLMVKQIESDIKALDYSYQSLTGMKPGSNQNWIVQLITSLLGSDTAKKLVESVVPGWQSGSKPEHSSETRGKYHDKTPY